jgi:hypothetical protein
MQHAESLETFLQGLASGLDRGSPMKWADAVFMGEIRSDVLHVYDVSGQVDLGARIVGVSDDAVSHNTRIMEQLEGEEGGPGSYRVSIRQSVPKSLLGSVI